MVGSLELFDGDAVFSRDMWGSGLPEHDTIQAWVVGRYICNIYTNMTLLTYENNVIAAYSARIYRIGLRKSVTMPTGLTIRVALQRQRRRTMHGQAELLSKGTRGRSLSATLAATPWGHPTKQLRLCPHLPRVVNGTESGIMISWQGRSLFRYLHLPCNV